MSTDVRPIGITVLQSVRAIRATTNPYISALVRELSREAPVELFSWRKAFFTSFDVFHVHWPELLILRSSRVRTYLHSGLLILLILRLRMARIPLVRTVHNPQPHEEISRLTRWLLRLVDNSTTLRIGLNPETVDSGGAPAVVILHPHYRDWYAMTPKSTRVPGRISFFGQVREYKNVGALIDAFHGMSNPSLTLHIGGSITDRPLEADLRTRARGDERIQLRFEHIPDDELATMITESALIALPYREMSNSGALLLALSLGRPALVPDNPLTTGLADEVGSEWVMRYPANLTAEDLYDALHKAEAVDPDAAPDLRHRDWPEIISEHIAAYERAIRIKRPSL
jgi:beta-1,4-mannosyltransferase